MKLTNDKNIPQIIMDAANMQQLEDRSVFDYSTTTIIAPTRQVHLMKRHKDEVEEDIVSWWQAFQGTGVHDSFERLLTNHPDYICEQRMVVEENGVKVGMKFDAYHKPTKALYDYKVTSTFIRGLEMKPEWIEQLNMYAYCLRKNDVEVEAAYIACFYKDWREGSAKYKSEDDYPQRPINIFQVPLWTYEEQEKFFKDKVALHESFASVPDDNLPDCPQDAVWEKPAKYAVYKKGADRAMKLCDKREEAIDYIKWKKLTNVGIEFREGERTRCAKYCKVAPFCNQYKKWLAEQEKLMATAIYDNVEIAPPE